MILKEYELKNIRIFLEESFTRIQSIDDNISKNFNKNLLWYTFIESIASIFYSNSNPGVRFSKTLNDMCQWSHCNKVLSPLFYIYLCNNHPCLKQVIDELEEFFWGDVLRDQDASSRIISADLLPTSDEMAAKTGLNQKIINYFRLDNFLWQVRNMGIHSRWQADYPTLSETDFSIVCDIKLSNGKPKKNWRIYIPETFLQDLAKKALTNFKTDVPVTLTTRNDLMTILYENFLIA